MAASPWHHIREALALPALHTAGAVAALTSRLSPLMWATLWGGEREGVRETSPHGKGREEYKDGVAEGGGEGGVKEGSLVVRTLRLLHLLYRLELAYSGSLGCV